jgi:F420-dependent oxidoreductase-like protein
MQISTTLNYAGGFKESAQKIREMEKAGLDLVWVAEAYGFDGPSLMGYLAALTDTVQIGSGILPIYTRTPTLLAMTAAGVDALSDGRCHLGLGASGPQVIEGWHGVPYEAPVARSREVVAICRQVWAREAPLVHDGRYYHLPLPAGQGTGLGRPLKIITHPVRSRVPIWLAALGEANVRMTAEVADGWLPFMFVPEKVKEVWGPSLAEGAARRDPALAPLMVSGGGALAIGEGEEVANLRNLARPLVALYVGGMGARGRNFYNDVACRYGYEKEAADIQDLYLAGKKDEAAALVPEELLRLTSLIGPRSWVAERVAALREAGVTHLQVTPIPTGDQTPAGLIGELKDLIS